MSSPLPSSGLPGPTPSSPLGDRRQPYNARRRAADPLNLDDDAIIAPEAREDDDGAVSRRRRPKAARNQQALTNDVPPVQDATGEAVVVHFEKFLSECVNVPLLCIMDPSPALIIASLFLMEQPCFFFS
jgi:hypothetical protein